MEGGGQGVYRGMSMAEEERAGEEAHSPRLAGGESYEWAAIPNLDLFFSRLYRCV